jgi:hypothetical protein
LKLTVKIESDSGVDEGDAVAEGNVGQCLAADDAARNGPEGCKRFGEQEIGRSLKKNIDNYKKAYS